MSDYLDPNNEELLKDFFIEARSQVDTLEQNVLVLENDPGNHDAVDEIFRAAHTLKGGAATVEMTELAEFTHLIEDVLDAIRSGSLTVNESIVDALLNAIDIVKAMLDSRAEGNVYHDDITSLKNVLREFLSDLGPNGKKAPVKPVAKTEAPIQNAPKVETTSQNAMASSASLTEYEILELKDAAGAGKKIYHIHIHFNEDNPMKSVGGIQVFASLKDIGTVLKTIPDFESLYEDNFYPIVEYFVASERSVADIERRVMIPDVTLEADIGELGAKNVSLKANVEQAKPQPEIKVQERIEPVKTPAAETVKPAQPSLQNMLKASYASAGSAETEDLESTNKAIQEALHAPEAEERAPDNDAKKAAAQAGSILRVDSKRIDNLLNLVSETVINKATFNQISTQFGELLTELQSSQSIYREKLKDLFDTMPDYLKSIQEGHAVKDVKKEIQDKYGDLFTMFETFEGGLKGHVGKFRSTAQNLGRITGELQEGVMRIRMVPISQIFSRFPRLVRDLSKTLNKKVNLVIEGEDTELDKSVIEDLLDPLMHSVRNALDHGIESIEERKAAGKSEEGTVTLRASNEGNMILIEIMDDGKGIDTEAVRKKAVERGLIHPSKSLTDIEAFNMIFDAGFSTASKITNISGRGVGLDVVRKQIEKLNGTVTVQSQRGKGSRFIIKLPLTLAIIQGLLVRVGKEIYSIPITSVIESHRIKPSEIKMIDNYEVFNVRSDVVSLLRLNRLFKIKTNEQRDYFFVVIVGTNDKKVGLMVDSLIGEEDVVIKPLRDQYTNSPGIAGASILGDGSVSLIIDVSQLLELGLKKEMEERTRREATIR